MHRLLSKHTSLYYMWNTRIEAYGCYTDASLANLWFSGLLRILRSGKKFETQYIPLLQHSNRSKKYFSE